jgi:hypothetical protein
MISVERSRRRAAFTVAELVIALMLLGTATAVMLPLMVSAAAQRRAAEQRQLGLLEAENLLDELLARPWHEVTLEALSRTARESDPAGASRWLPGLERQVTVIDRPEDAARLITVQVRWRNRAGDFAAPIRVTAWKFPAPEETP